MILRPAAATLQPTSKTMKMKTVHAFLVALEPSAPHPGTSKTMKMITVLCISYDSEARPPPAHFQSHENEDSPMHFL